MGFLQKDFKITDTVQIDISFILITVWISVSVVLITRFFVEYFMFCKALKKVPRGNSIREQEKINELKKQYKCRSTIIIIKSRQINTPHIIGFFKGIIFLPDKKYSEQELEHILLHELNHFLNKDIWLKLFIQIICSVYWWNPFVYLLKHDLDHLLELNCDLRTTRNMNSLQKAVYLESILYFLKDNMESNKRSLLTSFSFSKLSSREKILQRFRFVNEYKYKDNKKQTVLIVAMVFTYFLSYSIMIQPYYEPPAFQYQNNAEVENYIIVREGNQYYYVIIEDKERKYKINESEIEELINMGVPINEGKY